VLQGKAANLSSAETFEGFPEVSDGFFFVAVAEGFNRLAPIPPQAQVLQMAEGGRIVLGENAEKLFAHVALKTRTQEVSTQLQHVIQGALALISFANSQQEELVQLARSAKVTGGDRLVSVSVEYPVKQLLELVDELHSSFGEHHKERKAVRERSAERERRGALEAESEAEGGSPRESTRERTRRENGGE
jgi:hypothetical protein